MTDYGPHNPHPLSQMRTELVWEGKYDEFGNRREVNTAGLAMPLQKIETIDEPRSRAQAQGSLFDEQKAHRDDFRNRLIWGDNKLVMASLLEEFKGAIDLVYIDPPFDIGSDFTMNVPIGEGKDKLSKEQSTLEMIAYRDMWGRGTDSYLSMMYERLVLIKELLSETGSLFVHTDWHVGHLIQSILEDIFGKKRFMNQIVWWYVNKLPTGGSLFDRQHDLILWFRAAEKHKFNEIRVESEYKGTQLQTKKIGGVRVPIIDPETGKQVRVMSSDKPCGDVWRMNMIHAQSAERLDYATQKPEELIERLVTCATDENDLVADFFCGSGTTPAVAEKLGRRWIGSDLGRFSIHTTRKRILGIQNELNSGGNPYRSFDVFNLGRYERQWWQQESLKGAEEEHRTVVLRFFRAEILNHAPSPLIHGRKGSAFVHIDGIDSIFMRDEAAEVARAVRAAGGLEAHCLAWDFEMDIRQAVAAIEAELDIKLRLHRIPREIMEKNRTEVPPFYEVALLTADPVIKNGKDGAAVDIKLSNFVPSLTEVPARELEALEERAIESGFDFIDFWAVDFDWTPGHPFNHHWQDYRTRKDRSLKTVSDAGFSYENSGKHTACIKVVDVFGCDTSITVEIET